MLDLRQANKVRAMLNPQENYKIGICKKFPGEFPIHKEGDIVLFRKESERHCTIESPISDEWIARNKAENNGIRTIGTCVGVPLSLIDEVLI